MLGLEKYIFENDIVYLLPEIFLTLFVLVVLSLGVWFDKYVISLGKSVLEIVMQFSIFGLLGTLLLYVNQSGLEISLFNGQLVKNNLSYFLAYLILVAGIGYILIAIDAIRKDSINGFEYLMLITFVLIGSLFLTISNDFLVFYISVELQSLSLYILATYKQNSRQSTEAGLKYFVLGAIASGLMLFGMSLFYGFTGLLNFEDIVTFFMLNEITQGQIFGIMVSIIFILIGLLFKIGGVPFHVWLPDVYAGAPVVVTAFFAIVPKIAIFGFMIKVYFFVFYLGILDWNLLFVYVALFSIILGSLGAIYQVSIKRLLAYSAIGHTGFILFGFIAGNYEGIFGILMYILIYVMLSINIFGIVLSIREQSNFKVWKLLGSFSSLYNSNIFLGFSMCMVLFSIAGVPPLAGFYSKLYVFFSTIKDGYYIVSVLGILFGTIGAIYYLRLIKIMFFDSKKTRELLYPVSTESAYVIMLTSFFSLYFFLLSPIFIEYLHKIILSLYI